MILSVQFGKPSSKLSSQKYFTVLPASGPTSARSTLPRFSNCKSTPSLLNQSTDRPSASGGAIIKREPVMRWPVRTMTQRPSGTSHSRWSAGLILAVRSTTCAAGIGLSSGDAVQLPGVGVERGASGDAHASDVGVVIEDPDPCGLVGSEGRHDHSDPSAAAPSGDKGQVGRSELENMGGHGSR